MPYIDFLRELRGSRRGFEIQFNQAATLDAEPGFRLVPIFERGDTLEEAVARLNAVVPDADARGANRDAVTPEVIGLEKLVTRPERLLLQGMQERNAITVERLELGEIVPAHPETLWRIGETWKDTNPKRRAALAAAGRLEALGAGELLAGLPSRAPLHDAKGN